MRIAILSDVHANLPALEAVLADIKRAGVDARYVLGDLVGYAPWPNEVIERLRAERIGVVMGNYDDGTGFDRDECGCAYTDPAEKALGDHSFAWTKSHATDGNRAWLRTLASEIRFEADGHRFLLVHGSPRRMNEYLYPDKPDATFARIADGAGANTSIMGAPIGRTTRQSTGRGSSTSARPASRKMEIRGPAGRWWRPRSTGSAWSSDVPPTTSRRRRRQSTPLSCPASSQLSCARPAATPPRCGPDLDRLAMSSRRQRSPASGEDWLRNLPLAVRYAIAIVGTVLAVAAMVAMLSWLATT